VKKGYIVKNERIRARQITKSASIFVLILGLVFFPLSNSVCWADGAASAGTTVAQAEGAAGGAGAGTGGSAGATGAGAASAGAAGAAGISGAAIAAGAIAAAVVVGVAAGAIGGEGDTTTAHH